MPNISDESPYNPPYNPPEPEEPPYNPPYNPPIFPAPPIKLTCEIPTYSPKNEKKKKKRKKKRDNAGELLKTPKNKQGAAKSKREWYVKDINKAFKDVEKRAKELEKLMRF